MAKRITYLIAICMACIFTSTAQTKEYTLNIGDFKEFTVSGDISVNYKFDTDSAGFASFECSPKLAPAITFSNNKGKLKIEIISETPIVGQLPEVTIYSSGLTKATNLGDSTVCLLTINPSEKLGLKIMGNGTIKAFDVYTTNLSATVEAGSGHIYLNGKSQNVKYSIAGAGAIEGGSLKAQKATTWMFGTGSIDCYADKTLAVYGAGSGTIYYAGNPELKTRNLGVKTVDVGSANK